jgi:hypothetical protein
MNQIVNLAKLESEEADKEVIKFEAKCWSALERQRKGQKADELMGPLNRTWSNVARLLIYDKIHDIHADLACPTSEAYRFR